MLVLSQYHIFESYKTNIYRASHRFVIILWIILYVKHGVRSPKFIWAPCAQLYSLAETLLSYTRALLVIYSLSTKIDNISW